jgi:HAD superfamily hydrolase (TIGR01484 family)
LNIRAAVIDLDGTLIGKAEEISARVDRALTHLSKLLPVSIATGREAADTIKFARQLGLTSPQICDGGATILDPTSGRSLWTDPLQPDRAREIIQILQSAKAEFIATHTGGSITSYSRITNWNLIRVSALDLDEQGADRMVGHFAANPALHVVKVYLPYNGLWAVDFTDSQVDKAAATLKLARMIDVDAGDIMAAGDSYNDIPLLRLCGLGIAMGDAPDELKAVADFVAPPVEEDGLAVAIEEFVLPSL